MARRKSDDNELHVMSFGEHIEELRRRLIYGLIGLAVVSCVMLYYARSVVAILFEPLFTAQKVLNLPAQTFGRSTSGGMVLYLKVTLIGSLIIAAPWLLYQSWKFVSAGLYAAEKKAATFLVTLSTLMTACGLALTYYIFLPATVVFLLQFTITYPVPKTDRGGFGYWWTSQIAEWNYKSLFPGAPKIVNVPPPTTDPATPTIIPIYLNDPTPLVEGQIWRNFNLNETRGYQNGNIVVYVTSPESMMGPMIDPTEYLSEALMLTLAVVVVFHVPVVMCVLGMSGLVSPKTLAKKRMIVFFVCFLLAFFFVPGQDIFSNFAIPLLGYALFEVGLILMGIFYRRHERRKAEDDAKYAAAESP